MTDTVGHVDGAPPSMTLTCILTTARIEMASDNRRRAVRANRGG